MANGDEARAERLRRWNRLEMELSDLADLRKAHERAHDSLGVLCGRALFSDARAVSVWLEREWQRLDEARADIDAEERRIRRAWLALTKENDDA